MEPSSLFKIATSDQDKKKSRPKNFHYHWQCRPHLWESDDFAAFNAFIIIILNFSINELVYGVSQYGLVHLFFVFVIIQHLYKVSRSHTRSIIQ